MASVSATGVRSTLRSSLVVMGGFVLSRLTGLLRDIIVLGQFGTSAELGAYRAAFRLPDLLYLVVIGGALGSTLIPLWLEVLERDGEERAWRLVSAVVCWSLLALSVASLLLALFADPLVYLLYNGQGFDQPTLQLTVQLTRLFLLSPLLLGLGGLALAVLNATDRFTLPALAPSVYNLGILAGAMLAPWFGIWGLAWGVIGGALFYLLVQIPGLYGAGMRLTLTFGRGLAERQTLLRQLAPRVLGQTAAQINIVVSAALVARLPTGAERLVGLDAAYQLMLLPYGIFALSLSTVAFPTMARLYAAGKTEELAERCRSTVATICLLTVPSSAALIILAAPLVRVLFERGNFDAASTLLTVGPLWGYAFALPAFALSEIIIRSFYAMQDTRTPVLVGIGTIMLNIGLGIWALALGSGTLGIALAFSLANNVEAALLLLLLQRRLPGIWNNAALRQALQATGIATLATVLFLVTARILSDPLVPALTPDIAEVYRFPSDTLALIVWLALIGILATLLYASVAAATGASEVRRLWHHVRTRIIR